MLLWFLRDVKYLEDNENEIPNKLKDFSIIENEQF